MAKERYAADKDFVIQGHWSRPGGQHRPAGDLKYTEGKLELQLLGSFDDAEGPHPFERHMPEVEPAIIHGQSAKGTPVTLLNSFYTNWQQAGGIFAEGSVPISSSKLTCSGMLLGVHLQAVDEASFGKCSLAIPNLDRWLDDRPFEITMQKAESISVTYKMPKNRTFEIPGWGKFHFSPAVTPPFHPWDDVSIKHRTYVQIEPNALRDFEWFVEVIGEVERLFTLLFGRVVRVTQNRLSYVQGEESVDAYLYLPTDRPGQPTINPRDFMVRYPKIAEWFAQMLKSWFCESAKIRHALDLVFSSIQRPGHFLETRFMPFVQAVEVYSRVVNRGQITDKSVYKPIREGLVKSIPAETPPELRDAIVRSLGYANDRALRQRVLALIDGLLPKTRELFCVNPNDFAKGVVDTRNFLTHYSSDPEKALSGIALHWATIKLQTMMKVLLLKRLGIPEPEVHDIVKSNYQLAQDRQAWKEVPELPLQRGKSP